MKTVTLETGEFRFDECAQGREDIRDIIQINIAISTKRIADILEAHEKRVTEFYAQRDAKF